MQEADNNDDDDYDNVENGVDKTDAIPTTLLQEQQRQK